MLIILFNAINLRPIKLQEVLHAMAEYGPEKVNLFDDSWYGIAQQI